MLSMTGYGREQIEKDGREITVEIKTVNHRFLDVALRLPRSLGFAEDALRKQLGTVLKRGHADVNVTYSNMREDARTVKVDTALAMQYKAAYDRLGAALGIHDAVGLSVIAQQPDVMNVTVAEENQEETGAVLAEAVQKALNDVSVMRQKEGLNLKEDLTVHLDLLANLRDKIAILAPAVPVTYQKKMQERIRELGVSEIDPQRLAQEVALMADHCAIDEELSRLESHIAQMRETIAADGEVGRRLDFLTQELNREVNTIGSKASDAGITKLVVEAKSEIEKLREQVQNVE